MWISIYDQEPEQGRDLWYYFEIVGVHKGQYYGKDEICDETVFGGKGGFLGGDVTHWQYDEGQERPDPPEE